MDYKELVAGALANVLEGSLSKEEIYNLVEKPKNADHGDLAFPCFTLAKALRKSPVAIAQELAEKIDGADFDGVLAIGPYINFRLNRQVVASNVLEEIHEKGEAYGSSNIGQGGNVTIDMSSPNIAKPFSMGHLRSTVIGNAIANLMAKAGYNPIKINHLGDWGTQFGKLIVAYKLWGTPEEVKADPIKELLRLYVKFHEEAEIHPELEDEGRLWFKKLEDGDEEAQELWTWFKDESMKEFNRVYDMLDVKFDHNTGESFYNDKMQEVIDILKDKGLLKVNRGAHIVELDKYDLNPALIMKTNGSTLYITRDLATALYRNRTFNFVQSLYVVGSEQANHFKQLKAVLNEMGFEKSKDMHHIEFGLITLGGKKLSTRKGKIVLLEQVLKDSVALAKKQIEEKNPNLENKDEVAHQVGVGAVVFHDLKNDRRNNFDFNLEEVVQFEGETGPYVQYTYARTQSILEKAKGLKIENETYELSDDYSWSVIKLLENYPNITKLAVEKYEPSIIAKYVINLAQAFNKYYANSKILVEDQALYARLRLVEATATVIKDGLGLLGVHAPKEM
ncbi:arginine--tRNA ligase [Atopobacter sp. AH10]|uniref:arginine--tRNA ligase n=1 Tax=Atopobacter sp. AH10 TaxID=2315861 RepID=UPI000EF21CE7|nr:arginine--tRNA ligase [Atopobacter sp. AH10]RLK63684.1 arginine--tRNA ligase [Atopobacter sp. AH10]